MSKFVAQLPEQCLLEYEFVLEYEPLARNTWTIL